MDSVSRNGSACGCKIGIVRTPRRRTLGNVNRDGEVRKKFAESGRTREWLAEATGYADSTVKQYLNGSKSSRPFMEKAFKALEEDRAARAREAKPLQWDLLFETEEQFRKVDRASRLVGSGDMIGFCRATLLARAEQILTEKARSRYPAGALAPVESAKVAEGDGGSQPG